MSSKNLGLPNTRISSHISLPDAGSGSLVPAVASVVAGVAVGAAGMEAEGAVVGCVCLMSHHVSPTGEHSTSKVRADKK